MRPLFRFARQAALTMISMASCLVSTVAPAQETAAQAPVRSFVAAPVANINITPRRVVFDGTKRTEAVYVFNQGTAPVTVDVGLVDNVMLRNGEIVPPEKLAKRDAADQAAGARLQSAREFILASPSRLTLPPGKGRTIRLRAAAPDGVTVSEWRTHLTVTTVPTADAGLTAEAAAGLRTGELAFKIQSVFGISIPLILRSGTVDAAAAISDLKLGMIDAPVGPAGEVRQVQALTFDLTRTGNGSIFGNLEVKSQHKKQNEIIGYVRGLAVYPEIDSRRVAIPLMRVPQSGETVSVTFISDDPQLPNLRPTGTLIVP